MIELNNLSYRYHNGITALTDVTTRIEPGIHLLLGENGAGKTTMLHLIAGLLRPTHGTLDIDGKAPALRMPDTLSRLFLYTDNMILPCKNINEFVTAHAKFYPTFSQEVLDDCLKEFGMTGMEPLNAMSFGNRRKAQLAYVIALGTEVLMLDEPANGLDITAKQALRRLIARHISSDRTVIISTHTVSDLETLFDSLMVIHAGRLIASQPVWSIVERLNFRSAMMPPEEFIYCEQEQGLFRYITAACGNDQHDTDINYQLLYNALLSPKASEIVSILNKKDND